MLDLGFVKVRNKYFFRNGELWGCLKCKVEVNRRLSLFEFN